MRFIYLFISYQAGIKKTKINYSSSSFSIQLVIYKLTNIEPIDIFSLNIIEILNHYDQILKN